MTILNTAQSITVRVPGRLVSALAVAAVNRTPGPRPAEPS